MERYGVDRNGNEYVAADRCWGRLYDLRAELDGDLVKSPDAPLQYKCAVVARLIETAEPERVRELLEHLHA